MGALTPKAKAVIDRMIAAGWDVRFRADGKLREWEFNKLCTVPGLGQFWRVGLHEDIETAASEALRAETAAIDQLRRMRREST